MDLDATDGSGSGVTKTEVRVDGGEWKPYVEEETILNTEADLAKWAQAGPGGQHPAVAEHAAAFDPAGLSNPGKLLPTPRLCGDRPGPYQAHPLEAAGVIERL